MKRRLIPTLVGLALIVALVMLRAADPYPVQVVRDIAFDFYQRLAPRQAADFPIRVACTTALTPADVPPYTTTSYTRPSEQPLSTAIASIRPNKLFFMVPYYP